METNINIEESSQVESATPPEALEGMDWFILQVYTGKEHHVAARIQKLIEEKSLQTKIARVLVPEEATIEIKNNKRIEKAAKIFPGYVFVQIKMDDDLFFELRKITGVAKFIGTKSAPTPVKEDEILKVLRKAGDKIKKIDVDYELDEVIKVISGPFRGYTGPISEINAERGKLKALISIFGRETPVEVDFDQVEKTVV